MSDNSSIPSDMWQALLRIESTTSRSEAKLDGLAATVAAVINDVTQLKKEADALTARLDRIEAERAIMVPEFQATKTDISGMKSWRTDVEATERHRNKIMMICTSVGGAQLVGCLVWVIKSYAVISGHA